MSTISKDIADRIIAGDFAEDDISCILRYENAFNGNWAYKIIPASKDTPEYRNYLLTQCENLIAAEIYWERKE